MFPAKQPEIGRYVRSLRQEMGLTQEKFAALLGVTFPTINRWENGRSQPSPLAMEKLRNLHHQAHHAVQDNTVDPLKPPLKDPFERSVDLRSGMFLHLG